MWNSFRRLGYGNCKEIVAPMRNRDEMGPGTIFIIFRAQVQREIFIYLRTIKMRKKKLAILKTRIYSRFLKVFYIPLKMILKEN